MRPDRIVVGECRSGEALDMLQAMNTGHDGSMTTIHANSSGEMLNRLETLVMFAGFELPSRAIREQIAGAVNLVVQIERLKDGSRKVVQVSEVLDFEGDKIIHEDIFLYQQIGTDAQGKVSGDIISTGYVPRCLQRIEDFGLSIPKEMFWAA
jgi:Flp pilus assembly CpaF family ATPase